MTRTITAAVLAAAALLSLSTSAQARYVDPYVCGLQESCGTGGFPCNACLQRCCTNAQICQENVNKLCAAANGGFSDPQCAYDHYVTCRELQTNCVYACNL